jgi:hypothetical protein
MMEQTNQSYHYIALGIDPFQANQPEFFLYDGAGQPELL